MDTPLHDREQWPQEERYCNVANEITKMIVNAELSVGEGKYVLQKVAGALESSPATHHMAHIRDYRMGFTGKEIVTGQPGDFP